MLFWPLLARKQAPTGRPLSYGVMAVIMGGFICVESHATFATPCSTALPRIEHRKGALGQQNKFRREQMSSVRN